MTAFSLCFCAYKKRALVAEKIGNIKFSMKYRPQRTLPKKRNKHSQKIPEVCDN